MARLNDWSKPSNSLLEKFGYGDKNDKSLNEGADTKLNPREWVDYLKSFPEQVRIKDAKLSQKIRDVLHFIYDNCSAFGPEVINLNELLNSVDNVKCKKLGDYLDRTFKM